MGILILFHHFLLSVCGIENVEYININVENEDKYDFIEKYFTE